MPFTKYKNTQGASGVSAFEQGRDLIKVVFSGTVYVYTYKKPGKKHVEKMKELASLGRGLSTYISQHVKDQYEIKYNLNNKI